MKKSVKLTGIAVLLLGIFLISQAVFATRDVKAKASQLERFKQNSMERYVYSKAIANGTSFEQELRKEKSSALPLAKDEYIDYKTKSATVGKIPTNLGILEPIISTEAKVVVHRGTGKIIRVEDFGTPYITTGSSAVVWKSGAFNVHRQSEVCARFSATGQFSINDVPLCVGFDLFPAGYLNRKTEVMTLSCNLGW